MLNIKKRLDKYHLIGSLDENSKLDAFDEIESEIIRLDLIGLTRLNSIGVLNLVQKIKKSEKKYEYYNAKSDFTDQMHIIDALLPPNARAITGYLSFFCSACDNPTEFEISFSELRTCNETDAFPVKTCSACGATTEFEPEEDSLYSFLENLEKITPFANQDKRILIVEDDEDIMQLLFQGLGKLKNLQLAAATSGDEAIKMLEISKYDLVICDLHMPKIHGFELIKRYRDRVDFFVVSGTPDFKEESYDLGAKMFFEKPVNMPAFVKRVEIFLGK